MNYKPGDLLLVITKANSRPSDETPNIGDIIKVQYLMENTFVYNNETTNDLSRNYASAMNFKFVYLTRVSSRFYGRKT